MIRHAEHRKKFLSTFGDDPRNVFVQFFTVPRMDQILPSANGENDLDINLGIRIGHLSSSGRSGQFVAVPIIWLC